MADAIISRQIMRNRGATAFTQGRTRDSHGFNPGAAAIHEFQLGYDTAKSQSIPASARRVEQAQGVAS